MAMAMRTSTVFVAATLVTFLGFASVEAGLPLVGPNGDSLFGNDGTCRDFSTIDNGQKYSFNLVDAESEEGHYTVNVKRELEMNTTDVKMNISFYFQCARATYPLRLKKVVSERGVPIPLSPIQAIIHPFADNTNNPPPPPSPGPAVYRIFSPQIQHKQSART